ncbi:lysozyme X-like [Scaptodrosophila lebanonensis]|uniref:lysozyme n=1 Tax=Drosophila lebanonensis TaxID=7225 RepID=A0A6J2TDD6_DROLE|nr:lysozyme X-like [Scaptodrosophila lebanonensis]
MEKSNVFWKFGICLLSLCALAKGRTLDRCTLARELDNLNVPRHELPTWVCIAKYESSFRTHVVGPPNTDGSNDYGIFQINDRYWCQPSNGKYSSNGCGINCDVLLSENIAASVHCAQIVKNQQGLEAWSVYNPHCRGQLESVDDCFDSRNFVGSGGGGFGGMGIGMYGKN